MALIGSPHRRVARPVPETAGRTGTGRGTARLLRDGRRTENVRRHESRRSRARGAGGNGRPRSDEGPRARRRWESLVDSVWWDLRDAIRGLRRSPGFAAVAILTLALGIGANTAIFSVVHAVLLRPLPYPHANQLVRIFENLPPRQGSSEARRASPLDAADLAAFRSRAKTLSHAGVQLPTIMTLAGRDGPTRLGGVRLSPAVLSMIDARPMGRMFDARDEAPGGDTSIIISSNTWERDFGQDPNILGQNVMLDGRAYSVVGVMPAGFQFPEGRPEFWIPFVPPTSGPNMRQRLPLLARVNDGVSLSAAAVEVGALLAQLRGDPTAEGAPAAARFSLVGLQDLLVSPVKPALLVLTAAVGFILLIACVNVANLMLARTAARQRETAIRLALGAGRGRLARQALTESGTAGPRRRRGRNRARLRRHSAVADARHEPPETGPRPRAQHSEAGRGGD